MAITEKPRGPLSIYDRFIKLREEIPNGGYPEHVVIVPDGNRRYADELLGGQPALIGHQAGMETTLTILRDLRELPIKYITFWAFSADNWKRPKDEREGLMKMLTYGIYQNIDELNSDNARFVHLGRKDRILPELREAVEYAEAKTANNTGKVISLAIDFGGVDQRTRMIKEAVRRTLNGQITNEDEIDDLYAEQLQDGHGLVPPADLLIRTKEERTSDIGWLNGARTEFYCIKDKFFPQVTTEDIIEALINFAHRQRRHGA